MKPTQKMNEVFVRFMIENETKENVIKFIAEAMTNRDELVRALEKQIEKMK
jgi:hypothetical protein